MNTLMTLDKYRIPYHQVNVMEEEKDYYKKLNNMPFFPQIFLITENQSSNRRKTKKKSKKNQEDQEDASVAAASNGSTVKYKIGGDQDFQVIIRFAIELKNKKIDIPILQQIMNVIR
jgi:hypothetical protein